LFSSILLFYQKQRKIKNPKTQKKAQIKIALFCFSFLELSRIVDLLETSTNSLKVKIQISDFNLYQPIFKM